MRNDVLQNYLVQFFKYLAENFDNLKFQETRKVAIFRPSNSHTLHCHGECGLFTLYLKGNGRKILKLKFIHVPCRTTMQNFIYSLEEELNILEEELNIYDFYYK